MPRRSPPGRGRSMRSAPRSQRSSDSLRAAAPPTRTHREDDPRRPDRRRGRRGRGTREEVAHARRRVRRDGLTRCDAIKTVHPAATTVDFSKRAPIKLCLPARRFGREGVSDGGLNTNTWPMGRRLTRRCRGDALPDASTGACCFPRTCLRVGSCAVERRESPDRDRRRISRVRDTQRRDQFDKFIPAGRRWRRSRLRG